MKTKCVTIQMKATEEHFHVIQFMYKVVLTFKSPLRYFFIVKATILLIFFSLCREIIQ